MTLWELIQAARERYVGAYRQLLRQQRPRVPGLTAELTLRTDAAADVPIDFRVLRVDLLWLEPAAPPAASDQPGEPGESALGAPAAPGAAGLTGTPRVAAVALAPAPPLPAPHRTDYPDGQTVTVHAMVWDDCPLAVAPPPTISAADGRPTEFAIAALVGWLRRWRDRTDAAEQPPDADGLHGVVHSMTPPQMNQQQMSFVVDFGSAPPEAFTSLLATLFAHGVRTVEVGQRQPSGVVNIA